MYDIYVRHEPDYVSRAYRKQEQVFGRIFGRGGRSSSIPDRAGDGEKDSSHNATIGGRKVVVARGGEFVEVPVEQSKPTVTAARRTGSTIVRKTTASAAPKVRLPPPKEIVRAPPSELPTHNEMPVDHEVEEHDVEQGGIGHEPDKSEAPAADLKSVPEHEPVVEPPKPIVQPPPLPRLSADEMRAKFDELRRYDTERARQRKLQAPPAPKVVTPPPVSTPSKKKGRAGRGATLEDLRKLASVTPRTPLAPLPQEEIDRVLGGRKERVRAGSTPNLWSRISLLDQRIIELVHERTTSVGNSWPNKDALYKALDRVRTVAELGLYDRVERFIERCEKEMARQRQAG